VGSTDGDFPGICPLPEDFGLEKERDGFIFCWIFEGFRPGMQDILDVEELVLDICNV
jgi:hypothetical protein